MSPNDDSPRTRLPEDIFNDALLLPTEERSAFLDKECGGDSALREQIETLLAVVDEDPQLVAPPAPLPKAGEQLGKYQILEETGRGGMGVVYRSRDVELERVVALKVLPPALAQNREGLRRFRTEAKLLASLSHEHIATLHSLEESEGIHFLTMEFVEGRPISELLTETSFSVKETVEYGRQIALALEYAHARGVVHRDLKPANIMLDRTGRIVVLDFGIARAFQAEGPMRADPRHDPALPVEGSIPQNAPPPETSPLSLVQGTPGYMSPEQILGGDVEPRSDLWALGCVLYECLTQEKTTTHLSLTQSGHFTVPPPPDLERLPRNIPGSLERLIASCLQYHVSERPGSASLVVRELTSIRDRGRWTARRVAFAGVVVIALLMATGLWFWPRTGEVATVSRTELSVLTAADDKGRPVWTRDFGQPVSQPKLYRERTPDGDPPRTASPVGGILVIRRSDTENGILWFLDPKSGATRWEHKLHWTDPENLGGRLYITFLELIEWPDRPEKVIALGMRAGVWYASALKVLSKDNELLATYYHPGIFRFLDQRDLNGDGSASIIIYGANSTARFDRGIVPFESAQHPGFVALLDPSTLDGQGFPYTPEGLPETRDWPGMKRAEERSYLLIPGVHPDFPTGVENVHLVVRDDVSRLEVMTTDGRHFDVDAELRPRSCYIGLESTADTLNQAGLARFLPPTYIHEGERTLVNIEYLFP